MDVFHSLQNLPPARTRGGALTIGNFDGVHRGHQRLIARAGQLARPVVAMTFDPHPLAVLSPTQAPPMMTPMPLRLELLARAGADVVIVLPTDRALLAVEPEDFVRLLVERIGPAVIVEGVNFGFGHRRGGDIETLAAFGREYGFGVETVEPVRLTLPGHHQPSTISSTLVRRLVAGGAVEAAAECLGRPYRLTGEPTRGAGRGRRIGFPTINIETGPQLLPGQGVYAGWLDSGQYHGPAAVSIGPAPTFDVVQSNVEAYLLDFAGEFADQPVELEVSHRLRDIARFDTVDQLVAQVHQDVARVRELSRSRRPG